MQAGAKAELAAVEHEFSEYRAAQRSTPEADLARQLADANEQVRRAEAKAEKAVIAKQSYKEQVHFPLLLSFFYWSGHTLICMFALVLCSYHQSELYQNGSTALIVHMRLSGVT